MIELRSYRRVFELERRIYRVDRLRLNPSGVPVRGVVYFLALAAISLLAGALPVIAPLATAMPWYARALLLPGLGSALLAMVRLEGRPFHIAARALVGYWASPRRLAGVERRTSVGRPWVPPEILLLPDGSDARVRRLRYAGPGAVLVAVAHERSLKRASLRWAPFGSRARRAVLTVRELSRVGGPVEAEVVVLGHGARLATLCARDGRGAERELSTAPRPER